MILSNNNGTFTPVAGGTGTFIGTKAAFDAVKATLPDNTVAYITDDADENIGAIYTGTGQTGTSNSWHDVTITFPTTVPAGTYLASLSIANADNADGEFVVNTSYALGGLMVRKLHGYGSCGGFCPNPLVASSSFSTYTVNGAWHTSSPSNEVITMKLIRIK